MAATKEVQIVFPRTPDRSAIILPCVDGTDSRDKKKIIEEYFGCVSGEEDWTPRYNIAPTQPVPVVRQNPKKMSGNCPHALGPHSALGKRGFHCHAHDQCKSETSATKPAFRDPLKGFHWSMDKDLLHPDHNSKRAYRDRPRRMPVILHRDCYDLWLDPGVQNVAAIAELLKPYDAGSMRSYPVSTRINHVANDDRECSVPLQLAQDQNSLFS